jgi:predicted dehydrogenase
MNPKTRIGLIGLGRMGSYHLKAILRSKEAQLIFISDTNPPKMDEFCRKLEIELPSDVEIYDTLSDANLMRLSKLLDYCIIATPIATHKELGSRLAEFSIPSLIEKPLTESYASSQELIELFSKKNTPLLVGYTERFNIGIRKLKKLLGSEIMRDEKIISISTYRTNCPPKIKAETGVLLDLATHDIDILHYLTESKYQNVSAYGSNDFKHTEIIEQSNFNTTMRNDKLLYIIANIYDGAIVHHIVSRVSSKKKRSVEIVSTNYNIKLNLLDQSISFFKEGDNEKLFREIRDVLGGAEFSEDDHTITVRDEYMEPLLLEHKEFSSFVTNGGEELIHRSDILANQRLMDNIAIQLNRKEGEDGSV